MKEENGDCQREKATQHALELNPNAQPNIEINLK